MMQLMWLFIFFPDLFEGYPALLNIIINQLMSEAPVLENWGDYFYNISPYSWAYVGIGIALGASVIGAAWYFTIHQGESTFQEQAF